MTQMNSHLEIAIASIKCFTNDGALDVNELDVLLGLALRDNRVDEEERRVLKNIFSKVSESDVSPEVWRRIRQARELYGI